MLRYCQQTSDNLSNPHRMAQETVPLLPSKQSVGFVHEECKIHYRKTAGTAFLALPHTVWCKKCCFCVQTQRGE